MNWSVIAQFILGSRFGFQSAEKIRGNLIVLASRRATYQLGGSRFIPNSPMIDPQSGAYSSKHAGGGPHDAYDFVDVVIDGTNQTGMTTVANVLVRSSRPGISITPKIRNVTDSTDAGVGSACTAGDPDYAGTNQAQEIALTIASGIKTYRLMYTLSGQGADTWCSGKINSYATS